MREKKKDYKLEFEELIDILPCALYVIKDSIIIDCNNAALKIFGHDTKNNIIGLKPYELSPEKQSDGSLSKIKGEEIIGSILSGNRHIAFQWIHKRKNEEPFLADIEIYNREGTLYAIIIDINNQDKLKRKLDEKDYFYSMIFENHNSIMMVINPRNGKIIEANQSAIRYYGYTKNQLLNMNIQEINTLSEAEIQKEMDLARKEKRNYFKFIHRLSSNEHREVEVHSFPVEMGDEKLLFSIIYDVSDKVKQKLMFDQLFFASPYAVAILDKEQKIININDNFMDLFQYSLSEIKERPINHLVSPFENRNQIDENIELIYQGKIVKQEGLRKRKDGRLIEVEILGYPVVYHQEVVGVYIIYMDISEKKSHERQLLLFRKILENNSEGVVITDHNGYIEWVNNAFTEITEYSLEEARGRKTNILKSGVHEQSFYKEMWRQLLYEGQWNGEIWNKNKQGSIYSEWLRINSIKNDFDKTTHYVGVFKDLSEKVKIDRKVRTLQQKDSLTGLYNRNYFLEIMDKCIDDYKKEKEKFSIIVIDIEGFKEINDSLGHLIGDQLLIEISDRIKSIISEHCLLSRFEGDEFAILCKSINEDDIKNFVKILLEKINQPFNIKNTIVYLNVNVGISRFPEDGNDAENLMRYANIAMYKSKNEVEERFCFYSKEMSEEIEEKFYLANYLVRAIPNREFSIYYQPIFDIKKKGIVGAEALIRWNSPVLGPISPDKFIPVAEKTGQILSIGEWVIREVCNQINLWKNKGYKSIPISINVSVKQLEQIGFAKAVIDTLKVSNIKACDIELEITESVSSGDVARIVKNLKELKDIGIKISMDDFGTGFSSLGQLDIFELDKLKIDKIFIDDLVNVLKRQNLVKSIIAMAKSLNLLVVAEGIETDEQLWHLKELGCELGQGYLFSKPLSVEEIEPLLRSDMNFIGN